jgi:hypothetical protein
MSITSLKTCTVLSKLFRAQFFEKGIFGTVFYINIYCTENHWYTLGYKIFPKTNLSYKSDLSPAGG